MNALPQIPQADERHGLPSASNIERISLCPGSHRQAKGLREVISAEMLQWRDSGERIHLWLECPAFVDLPPEELEVGEACAEERDKLCRKIFPGWDIAQPRIMAEKRFWLTKGTKKRFSGRVDFCAVSDLSTGMFRVLIIDYKTNRGDVAESIRNLQLRALAVLIAIHLKWKVYEIHVAIVQPLIGPSESCCYELHHLRQASLQLDYWLKESEREDAPLVPGHVQCKRCPAKISCPAAIEYQSITAEDLAGITPQKLSELLDRIAVQEQVAIQAKETARVLLTQNPNAVPNWKLEPNSPARHVANPKAVFESLFVNNLLGPEQEAPANFARHFVKVNIGDLRAGLIAINNLKPQRKADEIIDRLCSEHIILKPKQPSLVRK